MMMFILKLQIRDLCGLPRTAAEVYIYSYIPLQCYGMVVPQFLITQYGSTITQYGSTVYIGIAMVYYH